MAMQMKTYALLSLICCHLVDLFHSSYAASKGPNALILSCGSANSEKDTDGRTWEADSKYIISGDKSNVRKAEYQDPSLPSNVPYMNARIFESETSYEFPVQDGGTNRTLLRLHFYPSSYSDFQVSDSFFSVTAGGITLLNNYSASITAEALSQSYIIKEYFLASSNMSKLRVTFKPSDKYNPCFAFVNGIEVIPSPEVFDEEPIWVAATNSITRDTLTIPVNTNSMETMFRLNVGGNYIPPSNDSGNFMRSWYDDTPYVFGGAQGVSLRANSSKVDYRQLPSYIAPPDVYTTWRSMGVDGNLNKQYNLTWLFQVEANFSYVVRFHWCEFDAVKVNQRVFNIYINNQTAQLAADVYAWTKQKGAPMKLDFITYVKDRQGDDELRVDLNPAIQDRPEWYDSILNGLEIFKVSDSHANLAGPNPVISDMMRKYLQTQEEPKAFAPKKSYTSAIIGGAAGGAAAFGVAAALFFVAINRKRKSPGSTDQVGGSSWLPIYGNSHSTASATKSTTCSGKSSQSSNTISSDAAANCRYFSLAEIKQATKNFDESHVIGVGGFGKVYKGTIDGETQVAIKRSNPSSEQGVHEFQTEIEMLSKLRHRHLVSLIGYCEEDNEMVLVYDYMGRGTLREHLYKGNKNILSWKQRLEICIGAARGLHYLHTGAKYTIIHRDVKTTNILLDDKWVAKVSDFGLSKTGPNMNQVGHVSTVVKGSFGYLDPEYFRRQQLTEKSDVYSFGVVLFEVICARPALNTSLPKEQISLADWALHCQRKGRLEDIIDPHLKGKVNPECLKKFAETAEKCLSDHGANRPSMGDVLWNLEFTLQLQDNPDATGPPSLQGKQEVYGDNIGDDDQVDRKEQLVAKHNNTTSSLGSDNKDVTQGLNDNPNDIFSQIINPKGR